MAKKEHAELLREGIAQWNTWRRANLEIQPDLIWADLRIASLSGASLEKAVLGRTHFARQDLTQVQSMETVLHIGPSFIDFASVLLPPLSASLAAFLRGTGQSPYLIAALEGTELPLADVSVNIIVSYLESDKEFADGLRPHLELLRSVTLLEEAVPSSKQGSWQRNAEEYKIAHLVIVLVSAPFLASPLVKKQILEPGLQHLNKGKSLVPVIVRPVTWQDSLLQRLQPAVQSLPVTSWSNRDEALHAIAQDLQPIVQDLYTKFRDEASQQFQQDLLLAQLIQARTSSAEQRGNLMTAHTDVQEASKAVADAEKRLEEAQKHLQEAQAALRCQEQHEQEIHQRLTTLQQTETHLLARIDELNPTSVEKTSSK